MELKILWHDKAGGFKRLGKQRKQKLLHGSVYRSTAHISLCPPKGTNCWDWTAQQPLGASGMKSCVSLGKSDGISRTAVRPAFWR